MARQINGYLGGFNGKLGPAVGYRWKNVWCLRSKPTRVNNPRTEAQQAHRAMFREEVRLAGKMRWAVNIGFKALSDELDMTALNLFVSVNQHCFNSVGDRFTVAYEHLSVSDGPVAPIEVTEWGVDMDNVLNMKFEKKPLHVSCSAFDNVYVWVWCPEAGVGYLSNPVYRRAKKISTLLPQLMEGKELHVYAFVQDEHGQCSPTAYGGPAHAPSSTLSRTSTPTPFATRPPLPAGRERVKASTTVSHTPPPSSLGSPSPNLGEEPG